MPTVVPNFNNKQMFLIESQHTPCFAYPHPLSPRNDSGIPNHKVLVEGLGYVPFGICWKFLRMIHASIALLAHPIPRCLWELLWNGTIQRTRPRGNHRNQVASMSSRVRNEKSSRTLRKFIFSSKYVNVYIYYYIYNYKHPVYIYYSQARREEW